MLSHPRIAPILLLYRHTWRMQCAKVVEVAGQSAGKRSLHVWTAPRREHQRWAGTPVLCGVVGFAFKALVMHHCSCAWVFCLYRTMHANDSSSRPRGFCFTPSPLIKATSPTVDGRSIHVGRAPHPCKLSLPDSPGSPSGLEPALLSFVINLHHRRPWPMPARAELSRRR